MCAPLWGGGGGGSNTFNTIKYSEIQDPKLDKGNVKCSWKLSLTQKVNMKGLAERQDVKVIPNYTSLFC